MIPKSRLVYTKGMTNTDPFRRAAIKLYRMREDAPCGFAWPSTDPEDGGHVHTCHRHAGHVGGYHKCACGVHRKLRGFGGRLGRNR